MGRCTPPHQLCLSMDIARDFPFRVFISLEGRSDRREKFLPRLRDSGRRHSDVLMSALHRTIPTYAAFPNLAWQAFGFSDLTKGKYSNYQADGSQRNFCHVLRPLLAPATAELESVS